MIPKIIHYCWFGGKEKPVSVLKYIETWKKVLPDYEIKEWNEQNFDINKLRFTKEAYLLKKYAFVADVCRLYALLTEGGLYFDTDVEVKKSFNELLFNDVFIGLEEEKSQRIGTSVIGAIKGNSFIAKSYDHYKNLSFILDNGSFNTIPNTLVLSNLLKTEKSLKVKVYPVDYFSPIDFETKRLKMTERTYSIHHFTGTWLPKYRQIESAFWKKLGLRDKQLIFKILRKLHLTNNF